MKTLLYRASVIAFAGALAIGCAAAPRGGSYGSGDPSLGAPNPGGGAVDPFLVDGQAVLHALDAIADRSGRPLRITSIQADRGNGLTVDVQEPKNHVDVDRYVVAVDGTLSGPEPVKLMSLDGGPITAASVDRQAFDPAKIDFARLTQTAKDAIAKSHFDDARVSEWEIDGVTPDDKRYIYLEASRGRPVAIVKPDLTIADMRY
ncbi:MAG: hypothetical protein JO192_08025 [Candidatus Eremiobacteraeota bacterium]|nr:hypothetical protein [Candidatus Eremiobacteraeota bacterium]MBV8332664.1 hypothetical protein [Candidatus Eremiobacteraeota bacterium]MBV8722803.1 hypothetical protein [Candidatus Eremiobacteraeota bacterium]